MMKAYFLLIFMLPLSAGALAKPSPYFELDSNHDGFISKEEAKEDATLNALFDQIDLNQDGYLSDLELEFEDSPS